MPRITIEAKMSPEWFANKQIHDLCVKVKATIPPEVVAYLSGREESLDSLAEGTILVENNVIGPDYLRAISRIYDGYEINLSQISSDTIRITAENDEVDDYDS